MIETVLFMAVLIGGGWLMFAGGYHLGKQHGREIEASKNADRVYNKTRELGTDKYYK